jgi:hypothetical protein
VIAKFARHHLNCAGAHQLLVEHVNPEYADITLGSHPTPLSSFDVSRKQLGGLQAELDLWIGPNYFVEVLGIL